MEEKENLFIQENLTEKSLSKMDFSSLVALVREPNMCSGGKETIRTAIKEGNINQNSKILEIGSNTGFSSIEFATVMPSSQVVGIDVNPISVEFAKNKAEMFDIKNVKFICCDATNLPFEENSFDVVFVSNVTSFISDKEAAIKEYTRVLKPRGLLIAAPISYIKLPPFSIVKEVEKAIGSSLTISDSSQWLEYFEEHDLSLYFSKKYFYIRSKEREIINYVDMVMSQEHLVYYSEDILVALKSRLKYFYELFDENLSYAGFDIFIYRYLDPNNIPILHKTKEL